MAGSVNMIELGRRSWRVCAEQHSEDPHQAFSETFEQCDLVAQAGRIWEALRAGGYRGEPLVLALESSWCLVATLVVDRPQELRNHQSLLYRLEELIPWAVEDCVADYASAGSKAFMVAVAGEPLGEFLQRLEALGACVQAIVPIGLLATLEHLDREEWPNPHTVAFQSDESIDLVEIVDHKVVAWKWFPTADASLQEELLYHAIAAGSGVQLVCYGLSKPIAENLQSSDSSHWSIQPQSTESVRSEFALAAVRKVLNGRIEAPVDLKQGTFGRNRGNVALRRYQLALHGAAALLALSFIGSLLYRAHLADRQGQDIAAQQADVFHSIFPNTKVPVGVRTRLESELAKLKGLQADDGTVPAHVPATSVLHRLLSALPVDRRFRLLEIRIEQGRLYLDGEVRDHSDAELIAQRLRAERFDIPSPRTQRLDDQRVSLRITGALSRSDSATTRKTR